MVDLTTVLIVGFLVLLPLSLIALIAYFISDLRSLRERPLMRSIRTCLELIGKFVSGGVALAIKFAAIVAGLLLGGAVALAVVKWAFEELAK